MNESPHTKYRPSVEERNEDESVSNKSVGLTMGDQLVRYRSCLPGAYRRSR